MSYSLEKCEKLFWYSSGIYRDMYCHETRIAISIVISDSFKYTPLASIVTLAFILAISVCFCYLSLTRLDIIANMLIMATVSRCQTVFFFTLLMRLCVSIVTVTDSVALSVCCLNVFQTRLKGTDTVILVVRLMCSIGGLCFFVILTKLGVSVLFYFRKICFSIRPINLFIECVQTRFEVTCVVNTLTQLIF